MPKIRRRNGSPGSRITLVATPKSPARGAARHASLMELLARLDLINEEFPEIIDPVPEPIEE